MTFSNPKLEPFTTRTTCRLCNSDSLTKLFSLGTQYVNDFVAPGKAYTGTSCPIELMLCNNCSLVQQRHTARQDFLYTRHYWYRSGINDRMVKELRDIVEAVYQHIKIQPGDIVLDIGANDGTLLQYYRRLGYSCACDPGEAVIDCDVNWPGRYGPITVGVEPATNLAEECKNRCDIFINDFWSWNAYMLAAPGAQSLDKIQKAKVITAIGMFYDLEDPNQFIADIAKVLHPDGIFIAQLMCLKQTVELADIGNFCHEHLEFYSLLSLAVLLDKHDLKIFHIEENKVNGGSYRLYINHIRKGDLKDNIIQGAKVFRAIQNELDIGLTKPITYMNLYDKMTKERDRCVNYIKSIIASGKSIWVYGASTKGNTILQWYGLDNTLITAAADKSPEKWGKVTIGTNIPIKSEEDFRVSNPDYALVLPYAFTNEFIERESDWRAKGGRFLVPLPEFKVI